jgi:hypothetical protein
MNAGMKMMVLSKRGGYAMNEDNVESLRKRDNRGRFRSEMDDMNGGEMRVDSYEHENKEKMGGYPYRPFPVYEGNKEMNQIGFNAGGDEVRTNYRMDATHHKEGEMEHHSSHKMGGFSSSMSMPMNKEVAEEWVKNMKNEDGTKGPHWKMDQVKQLMMQKGIEYNPWEFYAILNSMYSDYCAVFKKHGVNTMDMYVDLACAFLNDFDAMPNKSMLYYECIVKK